MKPNRTEVLNRFNGRCAYCGETLIGKWQLDHVIPQRNFEWHVRNRFKVPEFLSHLTLSDVNHVDNCFPACCSCNNYKSTFDIETFRSELEKQPERLRTHHPTVRLAERFNLLQFHPTKVVFYFETLPLSNDGG